MNEFIKENKNINLVAVNENRIKSYGTTQITFYIGKVRFEEKFVVVDADCLILGWSFLSGNEIAILPKERALTHKGKILTEMLEAETEYNNINPGEDEYGRNKWERNSCRDIRGNRENLNNISNNVVNENRGRINPDTKSQIQNPDLRKKVQVNGGKSNVSKSQPDDRKFCVTRSFIGDKEVSKEEVGKVN